MITLAVLFAAAGAALCFPPRQVIARPPGAVPRRTLSPPGPLVAGGSAAVVVLALLPLPLSAPAAVAALVVVSRGVRRLEPRAARQRRRQLEAALPQVVDLMSTCLYAGSSPAGALAQLARAVGAPMDAELARFTRQLALGADPIEVWGALARHDQLGPLGRALERSARTGGSVSEAMDRLGADLRARGRAELEARARTIEVKASVPLGVCLLPAFVVLGIVPMVAGSFSLTFLGS